jgi:hypothetical protein
MFFYFSSLCSFGGIGGARSERPVFRSFRGILQQQQWRANGGAIARRGAGGQRKGTDRMGVKIKATIEFSVSDTGLEDALAEYDELTVEGLLREVLDKAIACDEIRTKIEDGPNTLEEFDQLNS